jgi:hypothetical protein
MIVLLVKFGEKNSGFPFTPSPPQKKIQAPREKS